MKTTTRYVIMSIIMITMLTVFFASNQVYHQAVNFSYATRPLWDKAKKPFTIINHYFSNNLTVTENCIANKLTARTQPARVYDAILFSVELDLLEIRIREMYNQVEKFVIIESNSTFTGLTKPLVFKENQARFAFAKDKIEYGTVDIPAIRPGQDPFDLEAMHRVAMNDLLLKAGIQSNDWVLMMDVDEIPSWHTVSLFRNCEGLPKVLHLQLRNFLYSFEFLLDMDSWRATAVQFPYHYGHGRKSDVMLADAGWHCSFCFRSLNDFVFKMKAYSHTDRIHDKSVLDPARIQKIICEGEDIFDMVPESYTFKDLVQKWGKLPKQTSGIELPIAVLRDPLKYKFLLPGGCLRE